MKNIKKILLAGVLTTAVAGGALMPTVMSYAKKGQTVNGKKVKISMQAAKDIAMKNAKSGRIVSAELDRDKGKLKYEIDVVDGNIKKEYDIDANTGAILKVEQEVVKTKNNTLKPNTNPNPKPNPNPSNNGAKINMQEAKNIAMRNAKSGRIVSAELDRDKGKLKYEIDILDGFIKKEYDIDVNTGAILKVEHEDVRDDD